jgi:multidrug efflux pump subunit AcrA (membrane-fusion protein)
MSAVSEQDTLQMKVQKPTIRDAVYVDSSAIRVVNGSYYVYLLDENGFRQAVEVQVGDVVDGYTIITDGLSGGEQVTLN